MDATRRRCSAPGAKGRWYAAYRAKRFARRFGAPDREQRIDHDELLLAAVCFARQLAGRLAPVRSLARCLAVPS